MAGSDDAVSYRSLAGDHALLVVFLVSGSVALGVNGVPVSLPGIGAAFALSESEIGLVMSAFSASGIVAIPVVSLLADLYGRRRVVIPSLLLTGVTGMAVLGVSDFRVLILLRALQGIGFAGTVPLSPALIGDLRTDAEGSAAQGIRSGVNGLAAASAPVIAGALTVVAWQYPFALFAGTFPVAALVYRYYPEPAHPRGGSAAGRARNAGVAAYVRKLRVAADRRVGIVTAGGFALFFLKGGFLTFLPVYVVQAVGASPAVAGTLLGLYGGVRVVGSPLSGEVVLRLGRKTTIVGATGLAAVGIGVIPLAPSLPLLAVSAAIYALGEALLNPVLMDTVAAASPDGQRAGVMSGVQLLKNIAITVAPVALGLVIGAAGYRTAFGLAAVLGLAYGALVLVGLPSPEP